MALDMLCEAWLSFDATERPFVTARKAFLSSWTGCDENGEGCGERMKEKERERRGLLSFVGWPVSFESFDVRRGVLVERGFSFLSLCQRVVFMVLRELSMR